jgi:alkylated DNA repair dioxygenase AlkB
MRIALAHGGWLEHDPGWLPREEADLALAALRDELGWEQREIVIFGRRILQPRLIAWAGELGYRYSGQTLEPRPFTPPRRPGSSRGCAPRPAACSTTSF